MPYSPSLPHPQPFNLSSKTQSTECEGKTLSHVSRAMAGLCGQCRHSSPSALVPMGNLVKCLGSIARSCLATTPKSSQLPRQDKRVASTPKPSQCPSLAARRSGMANLWWRCGKGRLGAGSTVEGVPTSFVQAVALGTDHSYQAQELRQ